ncbi:MAG: transporter substrate-binding domain-containing protein [Hyphomicrobiales bacterium]|nr:transporter substrate-binding domain-containing protein [Hyphomicrobiales bacterium]
MRNLAVGIVLLILFAISPHSARAEDHVAPALLDRIVARGVLRVGTTGDYKPFTYRNPDTGKFEGFDIDQAEALAAAMGVKAEFVPTAWPNLAADFAADKFDIAMGGVSITLDRARKGYFSLPYLHEGKTPIARCADKTRYETLAEIDRPGVRVIVNPGGTNERFARAHIKTAPIQVFPDNRTIFDEIAAGHADVMMTDVSETKYQSKLHPGVLCSVHPDKPFDFAEKAYWMQRDEALKNFVDVWLHMSMENGAFKSESAKWFE